jgi:hypothetical protein
MIKNINVSLADGNKHLQRFQGTEMLAKST